MSLGESRRDRFAPATVNISASADQDLATTVIASDKQQRMPALAARVVASGGHRVTVV